MMIQKTVLLGSVPNIFDQPTYINQADQILETVIIQILQF